MIDVDLSVVAGILSAMEVRFYIDPVTRRPHLHQHDITEVEAIEVLATPSEDRPGSEDSRVVIGRTGGGRYLRVIYVPDEDGEGIFVVTAYELKSKPLAAFRRRMRRRR